MQKDRSVRVIAILAICISVVGLMVGYATLSSLLTINTTTVIPKTTWDIHFEDLTVSNKSEGVVATSEISSEDTTKINVNATLNKPGDYVEYTFNVVNAGTIAAVLEGAPAAPTLSEDEAKLISIEFTKADGNAWNTTDVLAATSGTQGGKLKITYKDTITAEDIPADEVTIAFSESLKYVQK